MFLKRHIKLYKKKHENQILIITKLNLYWFFSLLNCDPIGTIKGNKCKI